MKIAFVYDAVYPWVKGGAEKRIYELARRLASKGHQVHWYGMGYWWAEKGKKDIEMDSNPDNMIRYEQKGFDVKKSFRKK